jgi:hypothetical protein
MAVSKKKNRRKGKYAALKWETARELHLDDDLQKGALTTREAGKIGGQMVRKLVEAGEKSLEVNQETKNIEKRA